MLDKHLTNGEKSGIVRMEESLKKEKQDLKSTFRRSEVFEIQKIRKKGRRSRDVYRDFCNEKKRLSPPTDLLSFGRIRRLAPRFVRSCFFQGHKSSTAHAFAQVGHFKNKI